MICLKSSEFMNTLIESSSASEVVIDVPHHFLITFLRLSGTNKQNQLWQQLIILLLLLFSH